MEINISKFVRTHRNNLHAFSDSQARSGRSDIGPHTWANAMMEARLAPLCADHGALRDYFAEFGAWEREELAAMDGVELNALLIQFVAGDVQAYLDAKADGPKAFAKWDENEGGRVYMTRGKWSYYVGM